MPTMSTYFVAQDGFRFEVRMDDANGRVVATFSNKLAADKFAERQRGIDEAAANLFRAQGWQSSVSSATATK
jgi:hypothetical protein